MAELTISRTETGKKRAESKATVKIEYVFEKNTYKTLLIATEYTLTCFINGKKVSQEEFLSAIQKEE